MIYDMKQKLKFTIFLQCILSIVGLLFLTWVNAHYVDLFKTSLLNIAMCLLTSYLLGNIFSFSKCTWQLVLVFYALLMSIFVPAVLSANSAIYLSVQMTKTARFFWQVMNVRIFFRVVSGFFLFFGVYFRYKNRHSITTFTLLTVSFLISAIIYELTTFTDAMYFYLGILGLFPILFLAMHQNQSKVTD